MSFDFAINWLALLFSFFVAGCLLGALFAKPVRKAIEALVRKVRRDLLFSRAVSNPVLSPGNHLWQAEAVMNPAAAVIGGRVHLIYRAVGSDGLSRFGYASSPNGIAFDDRLSYPAYVCTSPQTGDPRLRHYSPVLYPSGGSWGGCEDPRMVVIDGRVYVTFNLFENWQLRVGYITMSAEDFSAKRFYQWEGPFVLSHGARDKNWVLFPQKFAGKFAVLHSIIGENPERIRIEYIEDLKQLKKRRFESPDPQQVPDQTIAWHVHVRSAGPPPLKTDKGWLVFYHAHEASDGHYKLGAMLLDLADPSKVIARATHPVLEPLAWYENEGKPGIVYACGAVIQGDLLYLYYGGADKVVCVAFAPLAPFLKALLAGDPIELASKPARTT
ncbi:MAG: hypothetical protein ACREGR_00535 [Minisyncoccia bacterium]